MLLAFWNGFELISDLSSHYIMTDIIAFCNQKGGVGKTTTAINLSASIAAAERRCLLIDFDPQCNASSGLGIDKNLIKSNSYSLISGDSILPQKTSLEFLDVIPSTTDLVGAEVELAGLHESDKREYYLKKALEPWRQYDFIFIDAPPSLGLLTLNALTAAHSVIIPVQCEYYALEGLADLTKTIEKVREHLNPKIFIRGILLTMYDARNNLAHDVEKEIRKHFGPLVFQNVIPRNVRLSEAPSHGKPALLYDVKSKGAESYLSVAEEFLARPSPVDG